MDNNTDANNIDNSSTAGSNEGINKTIKIETNLVSGIVMGIISIIGLVLVPHQISLPKYDIGALNPRALPILVLVLMLIFSIYLTLQSLIGKKKEIYEFEWSQEKSTIFLILLMGLFAFLIIQFGYLIGVIIVMPILLYVMGERKPIVFIITLAVGVVVYFLFTKIFNVALPSAFIIMGGRTWNLM